MERKLKVCLISSTGGHLAQLLQLVPVVQKYNYFLVTEKNKTNLSLSNKYRTYFLTQQERKNLSFLFQLCSNTVKSFFILLKEKPDVIITTGAGSVLPMCILGKILRKKIVFIESFAKISSPTLTGRIIYKFADQFYIQWEELQKYYPKAKYRGVIY
ncbi:MAG: glycosyltransferase [Anoxybacillus sp.]|nr:PssD/Cps14F family polysaccharide biosynthesis glycosyltransferase [Anoxybacillus sp.]MCL6584924.1 glycosyltransferase [Anoxybacillus sp.]